LERISLFQWIWKGLFKTVMLPLMILGLVYLSVLFVVIERARMEDMRNDQQVAEQNLLQLVESESETIDKQLLGITNATELLRRQTERALQRPAPYDANQAGRLLQTEQGVYYTGTDTADGGAAVFYSAIQPLTNEKKRKVQQLLSLESLMKDLTLSNPLREAVFFSSYDSLHVNYPYVQVIDRYDPLTSFPERNYYAEADKAHNPARKVKWTEAYLDPDGRGRVVSSIAPVYNGEFLEGVVGIHITIETFVNKILNLKVPWNGFAILVDKDGKLLASPPEIEKALQSGPALSAQLRESIRTNDTGVKEVSVPVGDYLVAWSTMTNTGWKLLLVTPKEAVYANAKQIGARLAATFYWLLGFVVLSYVLMFAAWNRLLKSMTGKIAAPLIRMREMTMAIGQGRYLQEKPDYPVRELHETSAQIADMGMEMQAAVCQIEQLREEAEAAKKNLTSVLHSLDDVVFILDSQGIIVNIWSTDPDNLSAPADRMIGTSIRNYVTDEMFESQMKSIQQVFQSEMPVQIEYRIETSRGLRWRLGRIAPVLESDGTMKSVSVLAKDITDRKKMEASLRKAKEDAESSSKAKSEFLSSMSHELRTPLNAILGYGQLLGSERFAPLNPDQQEFVDEILEAGHHLLALINDVLDLARIEAGRIELQSEKVSMIKLVEDCLGLMEPLAAEKQVTLSHKLTDVPDLVVTADRTRLKEIVLNVLSNAVKYNKPGGSVDVAYEFKENWLKVQISDTGIGIVPEELEKVFDSFYRIRNTESAGEGTGIGLSVTKQLIELMDGSIQVESKPEQGSRFTLFFPRIYPELEN
jgi:PAS domain S-box-containing protein